MPQRKRPIKDAPKDGTPFLAYYDTQYPCVAVFDFAWGSFIIPERDGFMQLSKSARWVPLPEVEKE